MTQVIFQTRFAFQSRRSKIALEDAFAPIRMAALFDRFERFTLSSLRAQGDDDFRWDILAAQAMPLPYKSKLRDLVGDLIGDRAAVHFEPPAMAGRYFRNYQIRRTHGMAALPFAAQVALESGDAVASDFVAALRWACGESYDLLAHHGHAYLSFPTGYWLFDEAGGAKLVRAREIATRIGLIAFGRADFARNPYLTVPRALRDRHPVRAFYGLLPFYLKMIDGGLATVPQAASAAFDLAEIPPTHLLRFPMLRGYFGAGAGSVGVAQAGDGVNEWARDFAPVARATSDLEAASDWGGTTPAPAVSRAG